MNDALAHRAPRRTTRRLFLVVAALLALGTTLTVFFPPAYPCGPFFPPRIISQRSERVVAPPVGDIRRELDHVGAKLPATPAALPAKRGDVVEQTYAVDVEEVRGIVNVMNLAKDAKDELLRKYEAMREAYRRYAGPTTEWAREQRAKGKADAPPEWLTQLAPPPGLPDEINDYLRGALAHLLQRNAEARAAWEALLARPKDQRQKRSTWAAFMLARSYDVEDAPRAATWYARVRGLAKEGFADALGLASASLGAEARVKLRRGEWAAAIELYVQHHKSGDPSAAASVRFAVRRAFAASQDALPTLARSPVARRAVMAFIVARGGPAQASGLPAKDKLLAWLDAVEAVAANDVLGAERVAWAAYLVGQYDLARRFVARAPQDAAMSKWILAKLHLRDGKLEPAAKLLAEVVRAIPENERWLDTADSDFGFDYNSPGVAPQKLARAELGGVLLSRGEYTAALDALLRAGFWSDAAYVAERVLSPGELRSYVDASWPEPAPRKRAAKRKKFRGPRPTGPAAGDVADAEDEDEGSRPWSRAPERVLARNVRMLLAKRLARLGRLDDAKTYASPKNRALFVEVMRYLNEANDKSRSTPERARSRFAAATILRAHGMELIGTELEPDFAIYGGSFELGALSRERAASVAGSFLPTSADEKQRLERNKLGVEKRFHYRYVAAEHAWEAAAMLPRNSADAAEMLCNAGRWLKVRDPQFADRFYKALVRKNPNVALAQHADARRWFPPQCKNAGLPLLKQKAKKPTL